MKAVVLLALVASSFAVTISPFGTLTPTGNGDSSKKGLLGLLGLLGLIPLLLCLSLSSLCLLCFLRKKKVADPVPFATFDPAPIVAPVAVTHHVDLVPTPVAHIDHIPTHHIDTFPVHGHHIDAFPSHGHHVDVLPTHGHVDHHGFY